jgi:hypothetical protein
MVTRDQPLQLGRIASPGVCDPGMPSGFLTACPVECAFGFPMVHCLLSGRGDNEPGDWVARFTNATNNK